MSAVELTRDERAVRQTSGPVLGMVVFVASEAMFFATFFGAYFTIYSVNPVWPPAGFPHLEPELATVLTVVLVSSSVTITIAHHALKKGHRGALKLWLAITVLLGIAFLGFQAEEYIHAYKELGLTLGSGIYGATFFMLTGFHGAHVTIGTIILFVMLMRIMKGHFDNEHQFGFEAASWYWHFVDVVWIGLFFFVYVL